MNIKKKYFLPELKIVHVPSVNHDLCSSLEELRDSEVLEMVEICFAMLGMQFDPWLGN